MASSRQWMIRYRRLGCHFHPFFLDLDHCLTFCSRRAQRLSLVDVMFVIDSLVGFSTCFFWTWCDKQSCQARLHPSNRGRWFHVWKSFVQRAHLHDNQWNLALMETGVVSKMRTRLGATNKAAKPDCILPIGDDGSMYEDCSSGELIVMIINET